MDFFILCLIFFIVILLILAIVFGCGAYFIKKFIKLFTKDKYEINIFFLALLIFYTVIYISILYAIIFDHQSFVLSHDGYRFGLGKSQILNLLAITALYIGLCSSAFNKK